MKQFDELISVAEKLLSPEGCPWDLKQTFTTLQPYVLEEAHEVIEAVDLNDDSKILEELGDLLYVIVFYGKLGEKQGRFSLKDIIDTIKEKLIRRHPHIYGDVKVENEGREVVITMEIDDKYKELLAPIREAYSPDVIKEIRTDVPNLHTRSIF